MFMDCNQERPWDDGDRRYLVAFVVRDNNSGRIKGAQCKRDALCELLDRFAGGSQSREDCLGISPKRTVGPSPLVVISFRWCALPGIYGADELFETLWFIEGREYWSWDLDMKRRLHAAPIKLSFVQWYIVEVFSLLRVV